MANDLIEAVERILESRTEPVSARVVATQLLDSEGDREVLPYDKSAAFGPGDRIAWESPAGRLIGDVISCERVGEYWRLVVDWDRTLSPGLDRYLRARKDVRLSYMFDPSGTRPVTHVDPLRSSIDGPALVDLLEADLEEQMQLRRGFVSWSGQWTTWRRLPRLDEDEIARCLLKATADDGVAQTNQVLGLMNLPSPSQPGHGFAAMAVNLMVERKGGWIWGSNRDGGEWLPDNAVALVFARFGRPPRIEETRQSETIPDLADEALPEPLAEFVVEQTIRSLDVRELRSPMKHVLSRWERANQVIALDATEMRYFPDQARVVLISEGVESPTLIDATQRLLRPELVGVRTKVGNATSITFEHLAGTDTFAVEFERSDGPMGESDGTFPGSVLEMILDAFGDGQSKTADEILTHVLSLSPGDRAVISRLVAIYLATFACFTSPDDRDYRYQPDRAHNASMPLRTARIADIARRASRAVEAAEDQDRRMRLFRLSERAPHMVRGHVRQLDSRHRASVLQLAIARRHGLTVPPGSTFVRPHHRSG